MWTQKKKKKENKNTKPKFIDRESRLVIARDGVGVGDKKWAKGVKRYKLQVINKSWEYNVQNGHYRKLYYMKAYMKVAKKSRLKKFSPQG